MQILDKNISRFFEVEEVDDSRCFSFNDNLCETHFKDNYSRDSSGRFIVSLPFTTNPSALGESKAIAMRRFLSLERRLEKSPKLKVEYIKFMREYIDLNHVSPLTMIMNHIIISLIIQF